MNLKKILTALIVTLSLSQLCGCENFSSNKVSNQENTSENNEIIPETNLENSITNLVFKSKLGFSMEFPAQWEDKYVLKEDNNSVNVYLKSKNANKNSNLENSGLLFSVIKKDSITDESNYTPITGEKYITLNNTIYLICGPEQLTLSPKSEDFKIFVRMNNERKDVINTIKSLQ